MQSAHLNSWSVKNKLINKWYIPLGHSILSKQNTNTMHNTNVTYTYAFITQMEAVSYIPSNHHIPSNNSTSVKMIPPVFIQLCPVAVTECIQK